MPLSGPTPPGPIMMMVTRRGTTMTKEVRIGGFAYPYYNGSFCVLVTQLVIQSKDRRFFVGHLGLSFGG